MIAFRRQPRWRRFLRCLCSPFIVLPSLGVAYLLFNVWYTVAMIVNPKQTIDTLSGFPSGALLALIIIAWRASGDERL